MTLPAVFYTCSCSSQINKDDHFQLSHESKDDFSKLSLRADFPTQIHALPQLYYCKECKEIKCTSCTNIEPQIYSCPTCLFDVPPTSARSENNFCGRNCYGCPVCNHILVVVETSSVDSSNKDQTIITQSSTDRKYILLCTVCSWDSREIGWQFPKPTGLTGTHISFH
ncbi:Dynactin subunit 4 [Smittium mucronatum]|uniref:Dynactin subunit 4 n=1 Tax=Smittium mucronatum TaxID=133383 RepID=A0A1R0GV52_9FUNG|nr:Dynactin subunit 4 [Smittium mucronatum]